MGRVVARSKFLFEGEQKFYVRGVSYGTFRPNSRGEQYPEPERLASDFALMKELGANVVRTYVPAPPWVLEAAAAAGLRLMLGIPWASHIAFLDSRAMRREIRNTIKKTVSEARGHGDGIFAYTLGNEIRSDIVRWHGPRAVSKFLAELYDCGKQIDGDALFTYANYPSVEYMDLSFLDLVCFNVYLHREDDFRRYLTHLMAVSGDRPLVLSETGMDTIREPEQHQAELLEWQSRAAFSIGLSGIVMFSFTDEWHTGGHDITDWAFGLVTRERQKKAAFERVARIFKGPLPPRPEEAPKISVVIAAYNAEATIAEAIASVQRQSYPDFEIIVVDDGSTDKTADRAQEQGVKERGAEERGVQERGVNVLRRPHLGLSAARNAGVEAATGQTIAFIDADATADGDWLCSLTNAMAYRNVKAVGGPNFPPSSGSLTAEAIAAAPGAPAEVRIGEDRLTQMCGCNMAVEKRTLDEIGGFDPMFQTAGDDVDLSWRLTDRGDTLAYAPGAVVSHERRRTVRAYLAQQKGYGRAEALLFRKYPYRATDRIYGLGAGWKKLIGGSARVYYGAFGRGLFQTIYPNTNIGVLPELPLSFEWVAVAIFLLLAGVVNHTLLWFGAAAALVTVVTAFANAGSARFGRRKAGFPRRLVVAGLWIAGSVIRSYERFRARWFGAYRSDLHKIAGFWIKPKGELRLKIEAHSADALDQEKLLEAIRAVLIERGLAVGRGTGFADFDLEILINPIISIPINALFFGHGEMALRWRLRMHLLPLVSLACLIAVIAVSGSRRPFEAILSWTGLVLVLMLPAAIGDILETAAREGIERLGLRPQPARSKKAA